MFDLNSQSANNPNLPVQKLNYDWGYAGFGQKSQNHDNYRHRFDGGAGGAGDQFRLETMEEDSGVCSPPLWRSTSPPGSPIQSRYHHNNPWSLSPTSRAQAIARGQQELMDMVKNMPETSYELSLKDIVEQRRDVGDISVDETQSMEEGEERSILGGGQSESQRWKKKKGSVKRQESSKKVRIMMKNGSFDHNKGLLINMVFPFSFGSKKKSNSSSSRSSSLVNRDHSVGAKVSPKPELLHKSSKYGGGGGGSGGVGGDHRDWLWKRFTASSDNESLGITDSSNGGSTDRSGSSGSSTGGSIRSNSSRKNSGCIPSCWPFFSSRKKKS